MNFKRALMFGLLGVLFLGIVSGSFIAWLSNTENSPSKFSLKTNPYTEMADEYDDKLDSGQNVEISVTGTDKDSDFVKMTLLIRVKDKKYLSFVQSQISRIKQMIILDITGTKTSDIESVGWKILWPEQFQGTLRHELSVGKLFVYMTKILVDEHA